MNTKHATKARDPDHPEAHRAFEDVHLNRESKAPAYESDLSGVGAQIKTAPHESEPGHTYRLARRLRGEGPAWERGQDAPHQPFPANVQTVPVPDVLLGQLHDLSGVAVRAALLLIRKAYRRGSGGWTTSARYWTAGELEGEAGLGLCRESLRRAMKELAGRGWAEIKHGPAGQSYRWKMGVPEKRFTPLPLLLLLAAPQISHSALKLLLGIYRATWGWTKEEETDAGEAVTVHRRHERLSMRELRSLTGLSAPTVRCATEELKRHKAIVRARPRRGAAWWWRPSTSFLREAYQKFWGGSSRKRISNNTRRREADPNEGTVGHIKGKSARKVSAPSSRGDLSEEWKRRFFDVWTDEVGMTEEVALHYLHTRGRKEVHESTLRALRRKRADLDDPARYAHTALENLWHVGISNKQPDVRQSAGAQPIAKAFAALQGETEGWEWESDNDNGDDGSVASVEQRIGITHEELKSAVDALEQPPGDWESLGESPVLFVPDKELARWCWQHQEELKDEEARRWAKRLVQVRAEFEEIDV